MFSNYDQYLESRSVLSNNADRAWLAYQSFKYSHPFTLANFKELARLREAYLSASDDLARFDNEAKYFEGSSCEC